MDELTRLKIYKVALFNYRASRLISCLSFFLGTDRGFCNYFKENSNYNILDFPELIEQKPKINLVTPSFTVHQGQGYWFKVGVKRPRIKCLKRAIKLLKKR
jgi:hypothetical protein